jgi:hypothetical protein
MTSGAQWAHLIVNANDYDKKHPMQIGCFTNLKHIEKEIKSCSMDVYLFNDTH